MVAVRTLVALAALLLSLALPSGALAQGAGDEQYQDPFGDEQSQQEPEPTPAPAQPPPAAAPGAGGSDSAAPSQSQPAPEPAAPAQSGRQLPYTGVDAGLVALAGAVLLSAGIALRRRADHYS